MGSHSKFPRPAYQCCKFSINNNSRDNISTGVSDISGMKYPFEDGYDRGGFIFRYEIGRIVAKLQKFETPETHLDIGLVIYFFTDKIRGTMYLLTQNLEVSLTRDQYLKLNIMRLHNRWTQKKAYDCLATSSAALISRLRRRRCIWAVQSSVHALRTRLDHSISKNIEKCIKRTSSHD